MKEQIKICDKYALSTEEAAEYFHIGINKLRRIINDNSTADWVLWNGSHAFIKRLKFEKFLDGINTI